MVRKFETTQPLFGPFPQKSKILGHEIQKLTSKFVQTPQEFLAQVQFILNTLELQMRKSDGGGDALVRSKFAPEEPDSWWTNLDFSFWGFANCLHETYEAWNVAQRVDEVLASFRGKQLLTLSQFYELLGPYGCCNISTQRDLLPGLFVEFRDEVHRFETLLSLRLLPQHTVRNDSDDAPSSSTSELKNRGEKVLPFNLERTDVPRTLKRRGCEPVAIRNEDYWKLMEALMKASPNAVSEPTLKHLFPNKSDRDNAPKRLRDIIEDLGLTIKKWMLTELNT